MKPDENSPKILVIDDEVQIRRLLRFTLEDSGYAVVEVENAHDGLVEAAHKGYEAIILDLGLPDLSGIDMLRRLREWSETPVLILSVFGEEQSKIEALDAGADDYLTKPFGGGELLARLRALLRRSRATEQANIFQFGNVEVDLIGRNVRKGGTTVKLTAQEYALLRLLVIHHDKVVTHSQLLREVWGPKAEGQMQYLRVFMMRIRRKVEDDPDDPKYLLTDSGIGYRLVSQPVAPAPTAAPKQEPRPSV